MCTRVHLPRLLVRMAQEGLRLLTDRWTFTKPVQSDATSKTQDAFSTQVARVAGLATTIPFVGVAIAVGLALGAGGTHIVAAAVGLDAVSRLQLFPLRARFGFGHDGRHYRWGHGGCLW
jgi:hypothetical protein